MPDLIGAADRPCAIKAANALKKRRWLVRNEILWLWISGDRLDSPHQRIAGDFNVSQAARPATLQAPIDLSAFQLPELERAELAW